MPSPVQRVVNLLERSNNSSVLSKNVIIKAPLIDTKIDLRDCVFNLGVLPFDKVTNFVERVEINDNRQKENESYETLINQGVSATVAYDLIQEQIRLDGEKSLSIQKANDCKITSQIKGVSVIGEISDTIIDSVSFGNNILTKVENVKVDNSINRMEDNIIGLLQNVKAEQ